VAIGCPLFETKWSPPADRGVSPHGGEVGKRNLRCKMRTMTMCDSTGLSIRDLLSGAGIVLKERESCGIVRKV